MTDATKDAVWDVLVEHGGAQEDMRDEFLRSWPLCREFRFCGAFGFGGKVWAPNDTQPIRISYYPEDRTKARQRSAESINAKLKVMSEAKP